MLGVTALSSYHYNTLTLLSDFPFVLGVAPVTMSVSDLYIPFRGMSRPKRQLMVHFTPYCNLSFE